MKWFMTAVNNLQPTIIHNPNPNILTFGTKQGTVVAEIEKDEVIGGDGDTSSSGGISIISDI